MFVATQCSNCPTYFPKSAEWQNLCITCYKATPVKKCGQCEKDFKTNNDFQKVCNKCFKTVMDEVNTLNKSVEKPNK